MTIATDAGGVVTGAMTLAGAAAEAPIEWGYVKDDLITYRISAQGPAGVAPFIYMGKLNGGTIEFGRRPLDLKVGLLVKGEAKR